MNTGDAPNTIDLAPFIQATGAWIRHRKSLTKNGWVTFIHAAFNTKNYLDVGAGVAEKMLCEACASGDVRPLQRLPRFDQCRCATEAGGQNTYSFVQKIQAVLDECGRMARRGF